MADHLILVVHGIGEQAPGETVDLVLTGALAEEARQRNLNGGHPHPIIAKEDVVHLPTPEFGAYPEPPPNGEGEGEQTRVHPKLGDLGRTTPFFPMHLKRIRDTTPDGPQAVMAEVYWADKSPAPKGAFATIFDLVKVVMSLGYLALDNAANMNSRGGFAMVRLFLWFLIGGVVAINAMLLMMVLVLLTEGWLFSLDTVMATSKWWTAEALLFGASVLTLIIGAWAMVTRWSYALWRIFFFGALVWGMIGAIVALMEVSMALFPPGRGSLVSLVQGEAAQIAAIVEWYLFGAQIFWALAVVTCIVAYFVWWAEPAKAPNLPKTGDEATEFDCNTGIRRMYAQICSALLLLWMIMAASFWAAVRRSVEGIRLTAKGVPCSAEGCIGTSHTHVSEGIALEVLDTSLKQVGPSMAASTMMLLVLAAVGLYMVARRSKHKDRLFALAKSNWLVGRVLFNQVLQVVLAASTVVFFVVVCMRVLGSDIIMSDGALAWFDAALLIPLGLALLVYNFRDHVAGGLGALRDIVVYATSNKMNDKYGDRREDWNFAERREIEARFERVYDYLVDMLEPSKITIISHSQGTVIASRYVRKMLANGRMKKGQVTLVTMGSPTTHIYHKYFPHQFPVKQEDFCGANWFNVFRTDDFVGTHVEGLGKRNLLVPAAGHTGYFTDPYVWQHYSNPKDGLGFTLFGGCNPAPAETQEDNGKEGESSQDTIS